MQKGRQNSVCFSPQAYSNEIMTTHNLGFPRIGAQRELKHAVERYWAGSQTLEQLEQTGRELRARHWQQQADSGLDWVPVGDFAWYDHILEWTTLLGAVPARFAQAESEAVSLDTLFRMGRGRAPSGKPAAACEMTKWFDTNYHYIVPELVPGQTYRIARESLFDQVQEAQALGHRVKPVIPGPLSWLWLGKGDAFRDGPGDVAKLALLDSLLPVYEAVLARLADQGVQWVQIDEPILALDLPEAWVQALERVYQRLSAVQSRGVKLMLATYFDSVADKLAQVLALPVAGLHVDLVRAPEQLQAVVAGLRQDQVLSAGVIDGRNIWRTDLDAVLTRLQPVAAKLGERLWLAPSCSLLHVPVDLNNEPELDDELKGWLSFALQKLDELNLLHGALKGSLSAEQSQALAAQRRAVASRRSSTRIHHPDVAQRMATQASLVRDRAPFDQRIAAQQARLNLPAFPMTRVTIALFSRWSARRARTDRQSHFLAPTIRPFAPKSNRSSAFRKKSAWMCWCTASPNATTWSNTLASCWPALPLPATVGCKATVRVVSSRPLFLATWPVWHR